MVKIVMVSSVWSTVDQKAEQPENERKAESEDMA